MSQLNGAIPMARLTDESLHSDQSAFSSQHPTLSVQFAALRFSIVGVDTSAEASPRVRPLSNDPFQRLAFMTFIVGSYLRVHEHSDRAN